MILLYVLRRACPPCNKWGSVELAPDSPTALRHDQRDTGVDSVGLRMIARGHARVTVSLVGVRPTPAAPGLSRKRERGPDPCEPRRSRL